MRASDALPASATGRTPQGEEVAGSFVGMPACHIELEVPPALKKSMSLKYEPSSEPLHISVKWGYLGHVWPGVILMSL